MKNLIINELNIDKFQSKMHSNIGCFNKIYDIGIKHISNDNETSNGFKTPFALDSPLNDLDHVLFLIEFNIFDNP